MNRIHTPDLKRHILEWYGSNKQLLEKDGLTNREMAEIYLSQHEDCFHSVETILKYIRHARTGKLEVPTPKDISAIRNNIKIANEAFRPPSKVDINPLDVLEEPDLIDIKKAFFDVPESYASYVAPLNLDKYGKRMGIVSDIHFPIHDRSSVLAAHSWLKSRNIDCLLLLGDILDCSNITRHARRKTLNYTWREELEVGRAYIKSLRVLFPDIPIIFAEGNHENWFQQYIIKNAANLEGDYILQERLQLEQHDIQWVDEDRLMTYGKLFLHHGHKLGLGGGRNIATRLLDKHGVNIMVGHWHRMMSDDKRTLDENLHGAWINGCLSDLHPDYNPHNNSTHGVTIVDLIDNGMFNVKQFKIVSGKVIGE